MFKPATREQNRLRLGIDGPAGAGKTFTALRFAHALGGRIAVIDTEHNSATKYVGDVVDGIEWKFDHLNLEPGQYAPSTYAQIIKAAGVAGYDVLVIDSLSHAWTGTGGALDQVDRAADQNKFGAWRNVTPQHNEMIEAIMASTCHVIATLRTKMEYALEKNEQTGKLEVKKLGMKPVQREGMEYEFDIVADLDVDHVMVVSKSRCSAVDRQRVSCPTGAWIEPVKAWLFSGEKKAIMVSPPPELMSPPAPAGDKVFIGPDGKVVGVQIAGENVEVRTSAKIDQNGMIAGLVEDVKALAVKAGWSVDQLRAVCKQAGVSKLAELGMEPLDVLKQRLVAEETEAHLKKVFP